MRAPGVSNGISEPTLCICKGGIDAGLRSEIRQVEFPCRICSHRGTPPLSEPLQRKKGGRNIHRSWFSSSSLISSQDLQLAKPTGKSGDNGVRVMWPIDSLLKGTVGSRRMEHGFTGQMENKSLQSNFLKAK